MCSKLYSDGFNRKERKAQLISCFAALLVFFSFYNRESHILYLETPITLIHCVKSDRIRSYSGLHFPAFGLNTERCGLSLHIQSECGKMPTRITPNTDTFHGVISFKLSWVLDDSSIIIYQNEAFGISIFHSSIS